MGSQAGTAAGAIGQDLVTFVDQTRLEEFLQDPPSGFDVVVIQRNVGVIHVDQVTHALGHFSPHLFVGEYGFFTLFVEGADSVGFDVLLSGHLQLLFHFDLHGQSVGIPAGLTVDRISLHGLVTAYRVFQCSRDYVVDTGLTVGGRRSFIEYEGGHSLSRRDALFQQLVLHPFVSLLVLQLRNGLLRQILEHDSSFLFSIKNVPEFQKFRDDR